MSGYLSKKLPWQWVVMATVLLSHSGLASAWTRACCCDAPASWSLESCEGGEISGRPWPEESIAAQYLVRFLCAGPEARGAPEASETRASVVLLHELVASGSVLAIRRMIAQGADVNEKCVHLSRTPLHEAVAENREDMVKALLENGADVKAKDKWGWTPLHFAAKHGNAAITKALLAAGADPNSKSTDLNTPMHCAAGQANVEILTILLASGANANAVDTWGNSPLTIAIAEYLGETVVRLLKAGAQSALCEMHRVHVDAIMDSIDPSQPPSAIAIKRRAKNGFTPLHFAAIGRATKSAGILLDHGADINARDDRGNTALHLAALSGDVAMAKLLVDRKSDLRVIGGRLQGTPLHAAANAGKDQIVEVLVGKGAPVDARSKSGETPLHVAIIAQRWKTAYRLIKAGANLKATTKNGIGAIHLAVSVGGRQMVDYLLDHGAAVDQVIKVDGRTALHCAAESCCIAVARRLLQRGAQVDARTNSGGTPLMHASAAGHVGAVTLLLANGAEIDAADRTGMRSLHWAIRLRKPTCAKLLIRMGALLDGGGLAIPPLHLATWWGQADVVALLLKNGANAEETHRGMRAADIAETRGFKAIATLFGKIEKHPSAKPERSGKDKR